jgi:hypothetical protein
LFILGLVEQTRIDPAEHGSKQLVEIQCVVCITGKLQMMRRKTGIDQFKLFGFRVED